MLEPDFYTSDKKPPVEMPCGTSTGGFDFA